MLGGLLKLIALVADVLPALSKLFDTYQRYAKRREQVTNDKTLSDANADVDAAIKRVQDSDRATELEGTNEPSRVPPSGTNGTGVHPSGAEKPKLLGTQGEDI